jgi:hypothetical protein
MDVPVLDRDYLNEHTLQKCFNEQIVKSLKEHSKKYYNDENYLVKNMDNIIEPQFILDYVIVFNNNVKLTYEYLKKILTDKTLFILKKDNSKIYADETDLLELMMIYIEETLEYFKHNPPKIDPDQVTDNFKITINRIPKSGEPFKTLEKRYTIAIEIMTELLNNFKSCIKSTEPKPAPIEVIIESCTPAPTTTATSGGTNQQPHHKTNRKNYKNDRITKKKRQTTTYLTSL